MLLQLVLVYIVIAFLLVTVRLRERTCYITIVFLQNNLIDPCNDVEDRNVIYKLLIYTW